VLAARPLALVAVPVAFWALKLILAASSLGAVALVWRAARRRGHDPVRASLIVALNPALLVHVVGGAHNDALVMLALAATALAYTAGRAPLATAVAVLAAGVKASAAVVVPFLAVGGRRAGPALAAAGVGAALLVACALALRGELPFGWLGTLLANQAHASGLSFPEVTAKGAAALAGSDPEEIVAPIRYAYAGAFTLIAGALLWRTRRGADPIAMAGWATLALIACSAWLVPWYLGWVLPLAALAASCRLVAATIALTAWTLAVAIPF